MDVRTPSVFQNESFQSSKNVDAIGTASRHQSLKNEQNHSNYKRRT